MKAKKLLYVLLLCSLGIVASCSQSYEYVPSEVPSGAQVYFPATVKVGTTTLDETKPITIPVYRSNATSALTVDIKSDAYLYFHIPETVEFAAGEKTTNLVITYDIDRLKRGGIYDISIEIDSDTDTTPYGINIYNFSLEVNPWESLGMGQFYDQLVLESKTSYGIQPVEVIINKTVTPNIYRILAPYANTAQITDSWGSDNICTDAAPYIEFWFLENGKNVKWDQYWKTGATYVENDQTTVIKAWYPSSYKNNDDNIARNSLSGVSADNDKLIIFYPYHYIDNVGGFGCKYPCILSLPGGPNLEDIL